MLRSQSPVRDRDDQPHGACAENEPQRFDLRQHQCRTDDGDGDRPGFGEPLLCERNDRSGEEPRASSDDGVSAASYSAVRPMAGRESYERDDHQGRRADR